MSGSWYASDALWSALEHRFDSAEAWSEAAGSIAALTTLAQIPRGARVADLAAGTGRMAVHLAKNGHAVTAVERHPAFAQRLRKRAASRGVEVEIVRRDLLGFERAESFDAVLLWGDSFGYFESAADDRDLLARCFRSTRSEGKLVLQITPKECADQGWPERTWDLLQGDRILLEENRIVRDFSAVRHTWIQVDGGNLRTFKGTRRLYSAAELSTVLYAVGFGEVACFGSLRGEPFGRGSTSLIAVATR